MYLYVVIAAMMVSMTSANYQCPTTGQSAPVRFHAKYLQTSKALSGTAKSVSYEYYSRNGNLVAWSSVEDYSSRTVAVLDPDTLDAKYGFSIKNDGSCTLQVGGDFESHDYYQNHFLVLTDYEDGVAATRTIGSSENVPVTEYTLTDNLVNEYKTTYWIEIIQEDCFLAYFKLREEYPANTDYAEENGYKKMLLLEYSLPTDDDAVTAAYLAIPDTCPPAPL